MIDRERFIAEGEPRWAALAELVDGPPLVHGRQWSQLSRLYRGVCADLSRARAADLPADVVEYLDDLAGRAHNKLYGGRERGSGRLAELILMDVPREVRSQALFFWSSCALFYLPFFVTGFAAFLSEDAAQAVMSEAQLQQVKDMYSASIGREAGQDAAMAGYYVFNNVGIAFRCFATGALAGLGSVFFLVYNGSVLGTVFGHLGREGVGLNLLEFTAGHTAWELNGIVLAGAAGLRMGWAMIDTRGRTVSGSLRQASPVLFRLVVGAAFMLFVAAAIEGFWSAGPVPFAGKMVFGVLQMLLVILWLGFGGRAPETGPRVGDR